MISLQEVRRNYHTQGYNNQVCAPDKKTRLGGGCQASVELFVLRSLMKNPMLSMDDIKQMAEESGVGFFDIMCATKISFAAIPLISKLALPDYRVDFYHTASYEEIRAQRHASYFGAEAQRVYLGLNNSDTTHYGADVNIQLAAISNSLKNNGVAIPLLHTQTLYAPSLTQANISSLRSKSLSAINALSKLRKKGDLIHAVALTGIDGSGNISVVDPEPGYLYSPGYLLLHALDLLRIPTGALNFDQAQIYAKKNHPYQSVVYNLPQETIKNAHRWCTVTISPR